MTAHRYRVQYELDGKPQHVQVEAESKAAARLIVQNAIGPRDLWFTRTYDLGAVQR
jgi:hypothetical protein